MLDQCIIFTKSGLVLWETTLAKLRGNPVEKLIHSVLMGDRVGDKQFTVDTYTLKWCLDNKLDFVILIVHQKILTLTYVDELLEKVKKVSDKSIRKYTIAGEVGYLELLAKGKCWVRQWRMYDVWFAA